MWIQQLYSNSIRMLECFFLSRPHFVDNSVKNMVEQPPCLSFRIASCDTPVKNRVALAYD